MVKFDTLNRMKSIHLVASLCLIPSLALINSPDAKASASPYAVASRMCQMMNYGVSRQQAWKYVVDEYANGSMQGWSQTFGPPRIGGGLFGSLGGGIGYGIASGLRIGMELRGMRNEVASLVNNMCGEYSTPSYANLPSATPEPDPEPTNCWSAYLENNPAMQQWAEANPAMAAQNKKRFDDC